MDRFDWLEFDSAPGPDSQALHEAPHDAESFHRAARRMRESGHFRAASKFYEKTLSFDEHNYRAWVEWVDTLVRAGRLAEADTRSAYALNLFRQVRSLYAVRGLALLHAGQMKEAARHVAAGIEGDENLWYGHCVKAEFELRVDPHAHQTALVWLERATENAEPRWEAYFTGGWMLLDAQLPTLAAGYFAEACHANPRAPLGWLCLGDCFHLLRLYEQALHYYQRALELEPTHEMAIERQKAASPKLFGLLRVFNRETLRDRWNREFRRLVDRE